MAVDEHREKVIVVEIFPYNGSYNRYKVKCIEKGVTCFVISPRDYTKGDTIYHYFDN